MNQNEFEDLVKHETEIIKMEIEKYEKKNRVRKLFNEEHENRKAIYFKIDLDREAIKKISSVLFPGAVTQNLLPKGQIQSKDKEVDNYLRNGMIWGSLHIMLIHFMNYGTPYKPGDKESEGFYKEKSKELLEMSKRYKESIEIDT